MSWKLMSYSEGFGTPWVSTQWCKGVAYSGDTLIYLKIIGNGGAKRGKCKKAAFLPYCGGAEYQREIKLIFMYRSML